MSGLYELNETEINSVGGGMDPTFLASAGFILVYSLGTRNKVRGVPSTPANKGQIIVRSVITLVSTVYLSDFAANLYRGTCILGEAIWEAVWDEMSGKPMPTKA